METNKVCGVEISHAKKVLIDKPKITKLDIAKYYDICASKMLKFLKNRPISVIRCHKSGEKFYKKHAQISDDVERFYLGKKCPKNEYFYIKNKKQLIKQIQLGTVEFHAWNCVVTDLVHPDFMIFDLDPDENVTFKTLTYATKLVKKMLNKLGFLCFLKTSGGKGYHIYAKISNLTYYEVNKISKQIAQILEQNYPDIFVSNVSKQKRKNKIFIDYLRNKRGATCASFYCLRLRENAPVSMKIAWNKLDQIKPNQITIKNFEKYL